MSQERMECIYNRHILSDNDMQIMKAFVNYVNCVILKLNSVQKIILTIVYTNLETTANQTKQYLNLTLLHKYYCKSGMVSFEADYIIFHHHHHPQQFQLRRLQNIQNYIHKKGNLKI